MNGVEDPALHPFKICFPSTRITIRRYISARRSTRTTTTFTNRGWVVIREYIPNAKWYFVKLKVCTVGTGDYCIWSSIVAK